MTKGKELHQYLAQCLSEFFSTFMLILIGESAIAQYKFGHQNAHSTITINLSFAIGVYTGSQLLNETSQVHII
jgi:glycerol uptake facilitator-like aquaporin